METFNYGTILNERFSRERFIVFALPLFVVIHFMRLDFKVLMDQQIILYFHAAFTAFILCFNKSTMNEFKRLPLTEKIAREN